MSAADESEVPEGAAVFPPIPAELGVNPLLLATLHAAVFLSGSSEDVSSAQLSRPTIAVCAGLTSARTASSTSPRSNSRPL